MFVGTLLWDGCGGDAMVPPPTPPPVATSITLSTTSLTFHSLGDTEQLTATVLDQNGRAMTNAVVSWATSDPAVATISSAGLVTAVQNGAATVAASLGAASSAIPVTVAQRAAEILVSPDAPTLFSLGDTLRLSAKALDARKNPVSGASFAWRSSDESVATVDSAGLVTAVRSGSVEVSATTDEASGSAAITVSQLGVEVRMTPSDVTLSATGDTVRLSAEALDANGHAVAEASYSWSSTGPSVATVDTTGLVTATGSGTAKIQAKAGSAGGDHVGTTNVTVPLQVVAVRISPPKATLAAIGDVALLTATAYSADGTVVPGVGFTWSSSDDLVATVDSVGFVTARAPGQVNISASTRSHSGSVSIIVGETIPFVAVVADTTVRSGGVFDVALTLEMRELLHIAGAIAVQISFNSTLVQFDAETEPDTPHYWASVFDTGFVRIVISAPYGFGASSTLATLPFRVTGSANANVMLDIRVLQAIAADSFQDISHLLASKGQRIRIRP